MIGIPAQCGGDQAGNLAPFVGDSGEDDGAVYAL